MADYITTNIRNIALIGHGSEGKTTLTEAMLYAAGLVDRQGRVEDGTTMTDFDPEETRRKCSISAATATGTARLSTWWTYRAILTSWAK